MATNARALAGLDNLELLTGTQAGHGSRAATRIWRGTWPKVLAVALVIGVWELVYLTGWKHLIFPGPAAVFSSLWAQMNHVLLWKAIATTMRRAITGFALALLIGAVTGALVSRIPPLRAATGSVITALQTMPSIAWFPFAIILFGSDSPAPIVFVMVLGAAPSIANGLITGVDYTPPLLLRAGKTMGLSRLALYRHLILPASLPSFVAGLKQGWAFAWRSLMAGELLVIIMGQPSIGVLLSTDQDQSDMASATAIMIVILVLGIAVDAVFTKTDLAVRKRRGLLEQAAP